MLSLQLVGLLLMQNSIILWMVTSIILWIATSQLSAGVACDPEQGLLTGYCQLEPAEPRSHIVGRVDTP